MAEIALSGRGPLRKPRRLRAGDTVGLVAPARPVEETAIDAAVRALEAWELCVRPGRHIHERHGFLAGTDADRAADLNAMWADPEVDAIVCIGAGHGSTRLVGMLDREAISAAAKPFCGYSDITALHLAVHASANTITFYSIGGIDLGSPEASAWSKETLRRALFSPEPYGTIGAAPDEPPVRTIAGGTASGRLTGGCLPLVAASIGTAAEIRTEGGAILCLEDAMSRTLQEVDRDLVHLRDAGKLDGVAGIVIADMPADAAGPFRDRALDDVLRDLLGPLGVPVIAGLPIGHGTHHGTLPLGAQATLDAGAGRLLIDEPVTSDR